MRAPILFCAALCASPAFGQSDPPLYDPPIYDPPGTPAAEAPVAPAPPEPAIAGASRYDRCIAMALADPAGALREAERWRDSGGGALARHCRAMALAGSGAFMEAALAVEALAAEAVGDTAAYADLLAQAGDFRMAAADPRGARTQFEQALNAAPDALAALEGRARAAAALGDFAAAITDLNRILWLRPTDVDALALRAAARRRSGDSAGALSDGERAVAADPQAAVAWFERGAAKAVAGDLDGAEDDWRQAMTLDPNGEIGRLAETNMARLPTR